LLWASTGTKNPQYSDVKYIDALIGRTPLTPFRWKHLMPTATTASRQTASGRVSSKRGGVLEKLPELGICMDDLTLQLENEGVAKI